VNGKRIRVIFDTGMFSSMLSLHAAAQAGVKPDNPDVKPAGYVFGFGQERWQSWIAPFASFKIGHEEINNTHLRIGDVGVDTDMLLGFDFFLSHRVYVATSQGKLYFSYNGGPVFDLTTTPDTSAAPPAPDTLEAQAAPGTSGSGEGAVQARATSATASSSTAPPPARSGEDAAGTAKPVDAAGYGRRAAVALIRRDYEHAISDLTHGIELDSTQTQLFRDRASAYLATHQPQLARADLDHFLTLRPGDASALLERARAHLEAQEQPAAIADIDAATHSLPKQNNLHFEIGQLYQRVNMREQAISEYGMWIASHDEDAHKPEALLYRCRSRAELGIDLDKALNDCDAVLRRVEGGAGVLALETRGLIRLRRGELDRSIKDYDAALKLAPRNIFALYGRGLAKLRKGATADGDADLAAARAIQPHVSEDFARMGLTPP
jgi:tetratricopeptide (TPR) repeat protein